MTHYLKRIDNNIYELLDLTRRPGLTLFDELVDRVEVCHLHPMCIPAECLIRDGTQVIRLNSSSADATAAQDPAVSDADKFDPLI